MSFEQHPIVAAHLERLDGRVPSIENYQVYIFEKLSKALYEELRKYEEQEAVSQTCSLSQLAERTKGKLLDKIYQAVEQNNLEAANTLSQVLQRVFL